MAKEPPAEILGPFWVFDTGMTQQLMIRTNTSAGVVNICAVHANSKGVKLDVRKNAERIASALNKHFHITEENNGT